MKHIRTKYYDNDRKGQIRWQAEYDGDQLDGLRECFRRDGTILERINYKNDKLDGLYECLREDGSVCLRTNWKDGVKIPLDDKAQLNIYIWPDGSWCETRDYLDCNNSGDDFCAVAVPDNVDDVDQFAWDYIINS